MKTTTFFIVLFAGVLFANGDDLFDSYSYTGNYLINGTVTLNRGGNLTELPVTTVFDSDNQRIFSGVVDGPAYVVLHNASYVFNLGLPGDPCFINIPDGNLTTGTLWNYTREIKEYGEGYKYGDYYKLFAKVQTWLGSILDQTSCGGIRLVANFETVKGLFDPYILIKQSYVYTFYDPESDTCNLEKSILDNHLITYTRTANTDVDPYFELPSSCSNPLSFCDTFYPAGNPCFD